MSSQQPVTLAPESPGGSASPHGLILFDGVCVLCSRGCRFVSKRDRRDYFRYVAIQQAEGRAVAQQLGIDPDYPDSFVFVANGLASVKSEAALRIARELPWLRWTSVFLLIPRAVRDAAYDLFAPQPLPLVRPPRRVRPAEGGSEVGVRVEMRSRWILVNFTRTVHFPLVVRVGDFRN
jgi:predicted DCC family thiol-disulfide oxidoreductase YuxK